MKYSTYDIINNINEYIVSLRQCAKEHENENLFTGQIDTTALCNDTAKLLEIIMEDVKQ